MIWCWTEDGYKKRIRFEMLMDKYLLNVLSESEKIALAQSIDAMVYDAVKVASANLDKIMNNSE